MHRTLISSLLESLRDPPRLHAAMVHFPIVLAVLGTVATLGLLLVGGRVGWLRWLAVVLFFAGAAAGFFTARSGEAADDHLTDAGVELTDAANAEFNQHEAMGQKVWIFMSVTGVLVAMTAIKRQPIRGLFLVLALVGAGAAAAWTAVTAHYGGALVYGQGVGVPASSNNYPAKTPTAATPPQTQTRPAE